MVDHMYDTTPAKLEAAFNAKKEDLGIGEVNTFHTEAFDNLVNKRRTDFSGFLKSKSITPDQAEIKEKLEADNPNATIVRDAIKNALLPKQERTTSVTAEGAADETHTPFLNAQKDYTESVEAFKSLLKQSPQKYSAIALIGTMNSYKDDAVIAIKAQQQAEKTQLAAKLNSLEVTEALIQAVGADQVAATKKALTDDLEQGHQAQLKFFNDETNKSINELHKAAQKEGEKLAHIAHLYRSLDPKNPTRQRIERLALENADKLGGPDHAVITTHSDGRVNLQGISLAAVGEIQTNTGKKLTLNDDGSYSVKFSARILDPLYYLDPRTNSNATADMIAIATAVKAGGHKSIIMELKDFTDPEVAMKRGRQAYLASVSAGFPPDKITIVVNGKTFGANIANDKGVKENTIQNELFRDHAQAYSQAQHASNRYTQAHESKIETIKQHVETAVASPEKIREVKAEVEKIRQANSAPKPEVDENPGPRLGS